GLAVLVHLDLGAREREAHALQPAGLEFDRGLRLLLPLAGREEADQQRNEEQPEGPSPGRDVDEAHGGALCTSRRPPPTPKSEGPRSLPLELELLAIDHRAHPQTGFGELLQQAGGTVGPAEGELVA